MAAGQSGRDARLSDGCCCGIMQDFVPRRYRPSGGLDLNFFGGLSPRWAVANLYGLLATKILAQDILDRGAHLLLEPEGHIPGIIFRALEDQLVVDREEEVGVTSRILRDLLQSEVEDVSGRGLDRAVEALGVLRHLGAVPVPGGRDHPSPTENASCFPLFAGPVATLPVIEGREGGPEGLAILYGLLAGELLLRVLVDVSPVLIDAEAIQEA